MSARATVRRLRARVRAALGGASRRRAEAELREELESHLAMQVEENLRRGMSPEAARRSAGSRWTSCCRCSAPTSPPSSAR